MAESQLVNGSFVLTPDEKDALVASEAHDQGTVVAQIFSGIFFSGVAGWLTVSNGTKLAFVQKAALEKRLTVCCFLSTYVAFFSAFFNFFQLTAVDDVLLTAGGNFTLDLARPIEWIMTCPLMQLSLVLMGGSKIPEYRRYLMPSFSLSILVLGTVGAFFGDTIFAIKIVCFLVSCCLFVAMVYFNRLQIVEYSNGQEGMLTGDSEFRKATVLLIATWSPFPSWYLISPEGIGAVTNVLVIQLGWAFLNIVAKFSFIFYIQRVKDMYCNRLKTKRELQPGKPQSSGHRPGSMSPPDMDFSGAMSPGGLMSAQEYEQQDADKKQAQLSAVVVETMTFLGMAQHTERFLKLLDRSNMHSIYDVEVLDKEKCEELTLPFELVSALQRRLKVWKLEMVDDAEVGLDKGEEFWIRKGMDMTGMDPADSPQPGMTPYMMPGMVPMHYEQTEEQNAKLAEIEELLRQKLKSEETMLHESRSKGELFDKSVEGLAARFQSAMEAMEHRLLAKMDLSSGGPPGTRTPPALDIMGAGTATQRSEVRAFETRITAKLDEMQTVTEQQRRHELHTLESRVSANLEQQIAILMTKLDVCNQKIEACGQRADICGQKVETCSSDQLAKISDLASKLSEKLGEAGKASQAGVDAVQAKVEAGLSQLGAQAQNMLEKADALTAQTRAGTDLLAQKTEAVLASQTKMFAASEEGWRSRLNEIETNMVCRGDDAEAAGKRRHEEVLRISPTRRVEELATQVSKLGERTEQGMEAIGSSVTSEVQAAAARVASKTETIQATLARQLSELDAAVQRRLDQAAAQSQKAEAFLTTRLDAVDSAIQRRSEASVEAAQQGAQAVDAALRKAVESLATSGQQTTERAFGKTAAALQDFEASLPKRLEEVVTRCATDAAQAGATAAERRAEKAIEALESAHRADVHAAATSILEGVSDVSTLQARKAGEREERNMRRIEELLEINGNRATQKTEDVGLDVKKELHGFAKRLNSKIPFM